MLKKTITYTDYNGTERTEDFYFNLNKEELMMMELGTTGTLSETMQNIIKAKDIPAIIKLAKEIVLKAYGQKSADGKRFEKSEEMATAFSQTEAYVQIFMDIATNADVASEFMKGIIPSDYAKEIEKNPAALTIS